jgi:hypothetical protein
MVNVTIATFLEFMVGTKLYGKRLPYYLRILGLKRTRSMVLVIQPRQNGKTQTVAMAIATFLLCCPGTQHERSECWNDTTAMTC